MIITDLEPQYREIAIAFNNSSESYIKTEAAKLWRKLGGALGENLNKNNFRSKLEKKYRVSQGDNFGYCVQVNEGYIICDNPLQHPKYKQKTSNSPKPQNQTPIIDLTKAPELNYNYGRNSEISALKEWILENKTQYTKTLHLQGLGENAKAIFQEKGLKDDDKWDELIRFYQGHPGWLNPTFRSLNCHRSKKPLK
ncbi:MAG: hypothetical protein ACKPCP_28915 [Sphaerospermopsis kisseleviana]